MQMHAHDGRATAAEAELPLADPPVRQRDSGAAGVDDGTTKGRQRGIG
ncbi:hypothetical protein [uncultured Paracoccus sp.]|nr:hypothetical protein [uncultured Paracoccus sp.]